MRVAGPLVALAVAAAIAPATARGHGPCGCLEPRLAQAGSRVRVASYPAYRVVFNPRPADLGIAPAHLASAYRADVATTTVLERPRRRPTRRARFRVPPRTPPGVYLVLIFDGDEGGSHNSWEYLHVFDVDRPSPGVVARRAAPGRAADGDGGAVGPAGWVAALGAAVAVGGLLTAAALRRRPR